MDDEALARIALISAVGSAIDEGYAARDAARTVSTPVPKMRLIDFLSVFAMAKRLGNRDEHPPSRNQANSALQACERFRRALDVVQAQADDQGLAAALTSSHMWTDQIHEGGEPADAARQSIARTLDELNRLKVNLTLKRPLDTPVN